MKSTPASCESAAVRGSSGSTAVSAFSSSAASLTVCTSGPGVSCVSEIGTIPERLHSPVDGRTPTTPFCDAGEMIEPSVSVPMVSAANPDAAAAPEPDDEPPTSVDVSYGFSTWPPSELLPLDWLFETQAANSVRFVLPRMIAPAAFSRRTMNASRLGTECSSTIEAAVVGMPATSMLSLSRTGRPSSAPRGWPEARAASDARASSSACGFKERTALIAGPRRLTAAMRSR